MRATALIAAALAAAFAPAPPAAAEAEDLVILRDGRIIDGVPVRRQEEFLVLAYRNGEVRLPLSFVEDYVSASTPHPEAATEEERAKRAEGLVPWRRKWVPVAVRDREARKDLEERRRDLEENLKHAEWKDRHRFQTKNFAFESTQPDSMNKDFGDRLEGYFKEFAKSFKVAVPRDWGKLTVCFYGNRKDFLRTAGVSGGILAYYRFVEPRELNFYYDRLDPDLSVAVLYHEATHYLIDLVDPRFQYPHWINESMAEYYGASVWDPVKKGFVTGGIQQGRLAALRAARAAGKLVSLRELVQDESQAYMHYYWGWSLVHFLMETPKYRPKFVKFFMDLGQARDVDRRPHSSFPGMTEVKDGKEILKTFLSRMGLKEKDLDALEREWYAWIDGLPAGDVRGLEEGGLRAAREGMTKFRAPRLLKEAIDKGSTRPAVRIQYGMCMLGKEQPAEALKAMEEAVALDPLDGEARMYMAYALKVAGREEEALKALALAKEVDPGRDYLQFEIMVKLTEGGKEE